MRWAINVLETNAGTAEELVATPGAGFALVLDEVVIQSDDADAHPQLQDGDATVLLGPLLSTVEGVSFVKPGMPIRLTANKALQLKAAAAGNIWVYIEGRTVRIPR